MSLVAEDNAIEDTIYHLHRALNSGRIDLERFLRVSCQFSLLFPCCFDQWKHPIQNHTWVAEGADRGPT